MEEYKKAATGASKTKGLRKSLKQSETKKNHHQKLKNDVEIQQSENDVEDIEIQNC